MHLQGAAWILDTFGLTLGGERIPSAVWVKGFLMLLFVKFLDGSEAHSIECRTGGFLCTRFKFSFIPNLRVPSCYPILYQT
jgi:hypothetical protein